MCSHVKGAVGPAEPEEMGVKVLQPSVFGFLLASVTRHLLLKRKKKKKAECERKEMEGGNEERGDRAQKEPSGSLSL